MVICRVVTAVSVMAILMQPVLAFDLQGHRGARGLMPENTLPAFAKALEIGVSTLELDTGISGDGVVVVSHNPEISGDLARDTAGNYLTSEPLLKDLTLEQIQAYDVGQLNPESRAAKRFPDQQVVEGTTIPTLEQVFELTAKAGNGDVRFNIETKINPGKPDLTVDAETFARTLVEVIEKHELEKRVSVQSFDWRTLQTVQKLNREIETVYLTAQQDWLDNVRSQPGKASDWTAGFVLDKYDGDVAGMVDAAGGKVWSPFHQDLTKAKIGQAQKLGLRVIPWTVNDEPRMAILIEWGVDGIITDYPDRLRNVMGSKGLDLPRSTPIGGQ